jgi:hypothetical protein
MTTGTERTHTAEERTFHGLPVREPRALTEKFRRVPIAKLTEPRDGYNCIYRDHWWHVTADDEVLFYQVRSRGLSYNSPQCNRSEDVVQCLPIEGCTARQIPLICVPHECES